MSEKPHRHDGPNHEGAENSSPYPISRLSPTYDLVDVAREVQQADAALRTSAGGKLRQIAEQIRALQAQAREVLEQARDATDLHRVACNFQKTPGQTYHLYKRGDGTRYIGMLSPADWKGKPPHEHLGSYRLEADMTWTPYEKIAARDADPDQLAVTRLLSATIERDDDR